MSTALFVTIVLALACFDFGVSPLSGVLTTNRLALLAVACVSLGLRVKADRRLIGASGPVWVFPLIIAALVASSTIVHGGGGGISVVSWVSVGVFTLLFIFLLITRVTHVSQWEDVIYLTASLAGLLVLGTWLAAGVDLGIQNAYGLNLRRWLSANIPGGQSRLMDALVVLVVPGLIWGAVGRTRGRRWQRRIAVSGALLVTAFGLAAGSRQAILGTVFGLLVGLLLLAWFGWRPRFRVAAVVATLGAGGGALFGIVATSTEIGGWVVSRFSYAGADALTASSLHRLEIYKSAITYLTNRPLIGLGPNQYVSHLGAFPHNGYIGLALNIGTVPAGVILVLILTFVLCVHRNLVCRIGRSDHQLVLASLSGALWAVVIVLTSLNDLFREYIWWAPLTCYVAAALSFTVTEHQSRRQVPTTEIRENQ